VPLATLGGFLGLAVGLVMGAVFGYLNRQWSGIAVGGASGALGGIMLGGFVGALRTTWRMTSDPKASIVIRLDAQNTRFAPGETVSGAVEVTTSGRCQIQDGTLILTCRGDYVHDETRAPKDGDKAPHEESVRTPHQYLTETMQVVPSGRLAKGASHRYPFDMLIPANALPSHHGWLCNVRWTLTARLSTSGEPVLAEKEILIEAQPPGLHASHRVYATRVEAPQGHILLTLTHAVSAEGDEVEAQVHLSPLEAFYADEIRVVLLRVENTPQGDNNTTYVTGVDIAEGRIEAQVQRGGRGTTYVWLEDQATVEQEHQFSAADVANYVARLKVPARWRPTIITDEGSVHWKVGAVVYAEGYDDLRAFHEVIVHNGVPELRGILATE